MNATTQAQAAQDSNAIPVIPVQSTCCAPAPASATPTASGCGCQPGQRASTVTNEAGAAVSACCGKPVNEETPAGACCG